MKTAVVYCSQTGFTEKYARWIAEEVGCAATPFNERGGIDVESCDTLVFCSWLHAASIKGAKWLKQQIAAYSRVNFAVLVVGATPAPCDEWPATEHEAAFLRSFPENDYVDLPWFYAQGGFAFDRLGPADKVAMRMFFRMLEKKTDASPRDAEALSQMRVGFDATDRAALAPLLAHLAALGAVANSQAR